MPHKHYVGFCFVLERDKIRLIVCIAFVKCSFLLKHDITICCLVHIIIVCIIVNCSFFLKHDVMLPFPALLAELQSAVLQFTGEIKDLLLLLLLLLFRP